MELLVNSYMTVEEANNIVEDNFLSNEITRTEWESLTDLDKEIILIKGTRDIDLLHYKGVQLVSKQYQKLKFPRIINNITVNINDNIKLAVIIQGMSYYNNSDNSFTKRIDMQRQGVKSFSVGSLSETYRNVDVNDMSLSINTTALKFLNKYIAKGAVLI